MKYFRVYLSKVVEIPYEEGLLNGLINNNHLMHIAHATELKYQNPLVEIDFIDDTDSTKTIKIPLTFRDAQEKVSLIDVERNKKDIYLND